MRLSEVLIGFDYRMIGPDVPINQIAYDSRQVSEGSLFVAIKGYKEDGHDYVPAAVANGAVAILAERESPDLGVTQIIVADTRAVLGLVSACFYGNPSQDMTVIGVTGTNGKTTTTYLIKSILENAGYKVGLIGTIETLIGQESLVNSRTTPESLDLQRTMAAMVREETDYVVMEVSSHALQLHRTVGVEYDIGVFTNLTQDHLDFHPTFEDYFKAKSKLFVGLRKTAVINYDDSYGLRMAACSGAPIMSYGVSENVQVTAKDINVTSKGVQYKLTAGGGEIGLMLNLTGRFNVYNSLAAAAVCLSEGIPLDIIKMGLERVPGVPGRFEVVDVGQDFGVIVDYAHTPDSLENILTTARNFATGQIIVVFGAGGDRDTAKRPLMGRVAARLADKTIITSDNPRTEDPEAICRAVEQGFQQENPHGHYKVVVDRREAISQAIHEAVEGDLVIIAGKGHETYQEIHGVRHHFDDREEARRVLKELVL